MGTNFHSPISHEKRTLKKKLTATYEKIWQFREKGTFLLEVKRGSVRNIASLSLFCSYYFGRCSSELAELVPLPHSRGTATRYSDRSHDFSVTIPRCYKDVYVNSFFPRTTRAWDSLPTFL